MNERDCPHGRQRGKCADCDVAELEQENERLRAELAALKAQEPVAWRKLLVFEDGWEEMKYLPVPLFKDGEPLYAEPVAPVTITDEMAMAFDAALGGNDLTDDELEEIKRGLRAALAVKGEK